MIRPLPITSQVTSKSFQPEDLDAIIADPPVPGSRDKSMEWLSKIAMTVMSAPNDATASSIQIMIGMARMQMGPDGSLSAEQIADISARTAAIVNPPTLPAVTDENPSVPAVPVAAPVKIPTLDTKTSTLEDVTNAVNMIIQNMRT